MTPASGIVQLATTVVNLKLKHIIPNSVTVYGNQYATSKIIGVVDEFLEIWTNRGTTIDILE